MCCSGTDRDHGLGVLGPPNVLECEIGVERRTLAVAPAEPDQRPADIALARQVVRRAGFDLGDERVRGRKGGVPVPELVLGDNGDSAEPTREARLPVVLGLSSCLTPESKTFAQITACPAKGGEVPRAPADVERSIRRPGGVHAARDQLQPVDFPEVGLGRADVDECGRGDVGEVELLRHRERLLA